MSYEDPKSVQLPVIPPTVEQLQLESLTRIEELMASQLEGLRVIAKLLKTPEADQAEKAGARIAARGKR